MNVKICDICGIALDRENVAGSYKIIHKIFTPIFKGAGEKIKKLDICQSCMNSVLEIIDNKKFGDSAK